jgi:hypothetical protein
MAEEKLVDGFNIDKFRSNFQAGARQYLFYMRPNMPVNGFDPNKSIYLVRSTNLPEATLEETMVNWQGYDYKMASKYTYADWEVTFNVDIQADIHKWFTKWMELTHNSETNVHGLPAEYMADQRVQLLDLNGDPIITYLLLGAWPGTVGAIDLDYSGTEVAQFPVTFKYQRHEINYIDGVSYS